MGLRTVEQVSQSASSTLLSTNVRYVFFCKLLQILAQAIGALANKEIPFSYFSPVVEHMNPALGGFVRVHGVGFDEGGEIVVL